MSHCVYFPLRRGKGRFVKLRNGERKRPLLRVSAALREMGLVLNIEGEKLGAKRCRVSLIHGEKIFRNSIKPAMASPLRGVP